VTIASSPVYLDSSALVKLLIPEAGSDALEAALRGRTDLIVSDLAITEVASIVGRRVRERAMSGDDARRIYRALMGQIADGRLRREELTSEGHRDAENLLIAPGHGVALRAADALHLAMALRCGARAVVTYDRRMAEAAAALGPFEVSP